MKTLWLVLTVLLLFAPTGWSADASKPAASAATFDKPPAPTQPIAVTYPESAKRDGIEGKVLLSVVIGADGATKSVTVQQGVRPDLDQAAVKAVQATRWTPAERASKPVEAQVVVPIQFKLAPKEQKK